MNFFRVAARIAFGYNQTTYNTHLQTIRKYFPDQLPSPFTEADLSKIIKSAAKYHPDRFANDPQEASKNATIFKEINEAVQYCKDNFSKYPQSSDTSATRSTPPTPPTPQSPRSAPPTSPSQMPLGDVQYGKWGYLVDGHTAVKIPINPDHPLNKNLFGTISLALGRITDVSLKDKLSEIFNRRYKDKTIFTRIGKSDQFDFPLALIGHINPLNIDARSFAEFLSSIYKDLSEALPSTKDTPAGSAAPRSHIPRGVPNPRSGIFGLVKPKK